MNTYIYCFKKGLFIKKKFITALKNEVKNEFGELNEGKFIRTDNLHCKIEKDYNSYFSVYELSEELDMFIDVLLRISNQYPLNLACRLYNPDEQSFVDYIRDRVKNNKITVRATLEI